MNDRNRTFVHEWFERVWNQGDPSAIDELVAEDAKVHGLTSPDGAAVGGRTEFHRMFEAYRSAFPDIHFQVEDCVVDGDRLAYRVHVRGTHRGPGLGIEATGLPIAIQGMGFVRLRDGKLVETWNMFDFQSMNEQLQLKG